MDRIDIAIQLRAFSSLLVESSGDQFRCVIDLHCGTPDSTELKVPRRHRVEVRVVVSYPDVENMSAALN
jgi:hypothetical protein